MTDRLTATVAELAGDRYAGRRVGTPGGRAAAEWLAARLRDIGADVDFEDFPVSGVRDLHGAPVLRWDDGGSSGTRRLFHRRDFTPHLATAELPEPRTGRLACSDSAELTGCWVLAPRFASDQVTDAARRGALGVLVPRGTDTEGWMPKTLLGPATAALPVISVRTEPHDRMLHVATSGGAVPARVTANAPLRTVDVTGRNVYGQLREPVAGRPTVLLTAHYDGVGDDPDQRLPAAADNASGVAVVLEAARLLRESGVDAGLAVAFLDAEEVGAIGSAHHAPHVAAGSYVINVDGTAALDGAAAVEAGGPAEPLLAALDSAGRAVGVPLRAGAMPSDNRRYAAIGLPAVGIGMGVPGYQTPAETPDRVQPGTLRAAANLLVEAVRQLR